MKIEGSITRRHGSTDPDPDPHQNVMDPQHWPNYKSQFSGPGSASFWEVGSGFASESKIINYDCLNMESRRAIDAHNEGAKAQNEMLWRVCRPSGHHFDEEQDPDPRQSEKRD
jgi:hypothetical protein